MYSSEIKRKKKRYWIAPNSNNQAISVGEHQAHTVCTNETVSNKHECPQQFISESVDIPSEVR